MARSSECTGLCAQRVLDTADIVREAIFNSYRATTNITLMLIQSETGFPSLVAGLNLHCLTALIASASNPGPSDPVT